MVAGTLEEFGTIDILINCAGGVPGTHGAGATGTMTEQEWDRVLAINLKGPWLVTEAVLPTMKEKQYGKIVFISSTGAVSPVVSVLHYHAAKAGVIGLVSQPGLRAGAAQHLREHHRAGPDRDALLGCAHARRARSVTPSSPPCRSTRCPWGGWGSPRTSRARASSFASELSDYVTGQTLCVAGGQPMLSQQATFNIEGYLKERGSTMSALDGKVALVTGAAAKRSMGRAIAVQLARTAPTWWWSTSSRRRRASGPATRTGQGLDAVVGEIEGLGPQRVWRSPPT